MQADRDMVAVAVVVEGVGRAGKVQVMLPPALPLPQALALSSTALQGAIIGGPAERFAPFADLYRRALGM